jgi:diacylglycerol O-acyltransferase
MYQVDCEDASFLFLETYDSPTHISLVYIYDSTPLEGRPVPFDHIRQHIANRINGSPVFRQKIWRTPGDIDYPYWVDDERFDLDFHVRHLGLPRPGEWRQFCTQVARLHSRPLDMSRPLWELYVIEGLDRFNRLPPGGFALYFKVHHCAMDEFTAQELMESLHSLVPNRQQHESSDQQIDHLPALAPSAPEMVLRSLLNNSVRILRLFGETADNMRTLSRIGAKMALRQVQNLVARRPAGKRAAGRGRRGSTLGDTPPTRFSGPLTQARVFDGAAYPRQIFEDFAGEVPGASLTHAILTFCSEVVRLYLDRHGEHEDAPLRALLQVNVRNAGAHALVGNHLALNQVPLHSDIDFPIPRLQAIYGAKNELNSVENSELTSFRLRSLYEFMPAPVTSWLGRNADRRNSLARAIMEGGNLGLAELRGSDKTLYLLGAELRGFNSISPLYSGCGLMFTAATYCDRMNLSFTSDRTMLPDPQSMRDCMEEAYATLVAHLQSAAGRRKARRSAGSGKKRAQPVVAGDAGKTGKSARGEAEKQQAP